MQARMVADSFARKEMVRGDAKNKLPVWAYMKETIRKKKGLAGRKTSRGWFLSLRGKPLSAGSI